MRSRFILLLMLVFFLSDALAQGCSQCKLLSEQGVEAEESSFTSNINSGILYLMVFPYIILMFIFRKPLWRFFKALFSPAHPSK
jgi:hypothetical protein